MIGLAIISDRGDLYLPQCLAALRTTFPHYYIGMVSSDWPVVEVIGAETIIDDREHKLGLAGAVRAAWEWALEAGCDYLLHWEEDFLPVVPTSLNALVVLLERNPKLAQVSLKRQPWGPEEVAFGGFIERAPHLYRQASGYIAHSEYFSLNPCLIPRHILTRGWPDGNEAEFTAQLVTDGFHFGVYGQLDDPPRVVHVGAERSAGWRL